MDRVLFPWWWKFLLKFTFWIVDLDQFHQLGIKVWRMLYLSLDKLWCFRLFNTIMTSSQIRRFVVGCLGRLFLLFGTKEECWWPQNKKNNKISLFLMLLPAKWTSWLRYSQHLRRLEHYSSCTSFILRPEIRTEENTDKSWWQ